MRKLILIFAFSSSLAAQVQIGKNVQVGGTITGGGSPPGGATNSIQYNNGTAFGGASFNGLVVNNGTGSPPSALAGSSTVTAVQGTSSTGIAGTTGTFVADNLRVTDASGREIDSHVAIEPTSTGGRAIAATNIDLGSTASPDPTSAGNVLFWLLPGGNIIHYGRPTGVTATGVYQNSPTQGSLLVADDSIPAVFSSVGLNATLGHISDGIGFQLATGSVCPIPAGVGNICGVTINLSIAEPDTAYDVSGCQISSNTSGVPIMTAIGIKTTTGFTANVANISSAAAVAGGTITCLVSHH